MKGPISTYPEHSSFAYVLASFTYVLHVYLLSGLFRQCNAKLLVFYHIGGNGKNP
jgi:hypothetical protein